MLITSRTPLRVSFFGGGTDYPEYFKRNRGAVLGMAINKYIYISALPLASFIQYKYRVSYRIVETTMSVDNIQHPVVRAVLKSNGINTALDINIISDMPASSGLGSSSAFTVGLVKLVNALNGSELTRLDLGLEAIRIEREVLGERVGIQDQLHASFGGLNKFDFVNDRIHITPVRMHSEVQHRLMSSLYLIYTGLQRYASETLKEQIDATKEKKVDTYLKSLHTLTDQALEVLEGTDPAKVVRDFGVMMHEGWQLKRRLSSKITNPAIDALYEKSLTAGALGGKLCGAGNGGFLLMVVPPERIGAFRDTMADNYVIKIELDKAGSTILTN
jgi:D-glycero-alpha-D-manno-heptose-7-phosphate kinase